MIYLIDFENVHEEGFSSLGRLGEKDSVYCFFTRNVAKISMSALAGIRSGQLHFVEAESGKQSLDLALVSYLGYLIGTRPQEQCFEIVSNDNGFNKVAEFWNKRGNGLRVRVRKTNENRQKNDNGKGQSTSKKLPVNETHEESGTYPLPEATQKHAMLNLEELDAITNSSLQDDQSIKAVISNADEISFSINKPNALDTALLNQLAVVGINSSVSEFLLTQVEKYRNDKNFKQLVYRAVVKKYGQKNGTQIYNSSKKILLK